jgi:hypothetical protein
MIISLAQCPGFSVTTCAHHGTCAPHLFRPKLTHSLDAGDDGRCRGYNVAPAKGLMLVRVDYPDHSDISRQMYPEYPHDQYGRAYFGPLGSLSSEE